jgi:hypothetical protein
MKVYKDILLQEERHGEAHGLNQAILRVLDRRLPASSRNTVANGGRQTPAWGCSFDEQILVRTAKVLEECRKRYLST